ncbi:MAG: Sua5/YciO/YrdC/YwlC family protein [Clostridia bacterium]|nr:Sua5/YciO/YrdC/YwlC family protein [Clostridia bacterium]
MSGKPSGVEYSEIVKNFGGKVDYFIDGGKAKLGISSTIVQIVGKEVHILREGPITKEDIEKVLKEVV